MIVADLDFCKLQFYQNYVILIIAESTVVCSKKATLIRKVLTDHFKTEPFIMINYKKNKHSILPEVYKKGQLKNMKGLAIVSNCEKEREQALLDQQHFHKSFTFFQDIKAAKSWASSYFWS
ncbi:hypothetical protein NBT05_14595 [Aquimarina sp. ERC-38]|uniref:hypothetical protein n=1 Tax=Aquimarina sp. ERC-38 TaxID=2949996 RepID=UPI002245A104|nr:hypothetical protein [Aquimarina sp. ERC-38]UZO80172.1 hypothetical protein NBT05_14595 [Aquimarina sp. ERC-38]